MKPQFPWKKWSSVSAAAAVLLGSSSRALGDLPPIVNEPVKPKDKKPFEPLILKPPSTNIIPEQRFAGHVSHSSHSSHSSHYSGSGAYQPYVQPAAPVYSPAQAIAPSAASQAAAPPAVQYYAAPELPHRIELTSGAKIYGDVQVRSAAGITLRGWDGKSYKFDRTQLTPRTIAELGLPEQQQQPVATGTPTKPQTSDALGGEQKNKHLEQTIKTLQADNAALREQLRAATTKLPSATSTQNAVQVPATSSPTVHKKEKGVSPHY